MRIYTDIEEVAAQIVDSAFKIHSALGPGLLESAYQACLAHELRKRGLRIETEVVLPVTYDGELIDAGHRLDMRVEGAVIIENKAIEDLLPIHQAQLMTYLRLSGCTLGFLINYNVKLLRNGLHRVVYNHPTTPLKRIPQ